MESSRTIKVVKILMSFRSCLSRFEKRLTLWLETRSMYSMLLERRMTVPSLIETISPIRALIISGSSLFGLTHGRVNIKPPQEHLRRDRGEESSPRREGFEPSLGLELYRQPRSRRPNF